MEALKRFGEGTKTAKRIRKTLMKLMQICMTLVQSNPEHGAVILSALSTTQQQQQQQSEPAQQQSASNQNDSKGQSFQDATMDSSGANGVLPALAPDDPFAVFDVGMDHYWTDNSLDLFTDLVGVEPGLTAMMAG